jgi:serine/threonine protein phosphatase PrpC
VPGFEPVRYAALTDVGVKRSHNQDACAAQPAADKPGWEAVGHVFVVADGMGGHAVGEKASAKAVRDIPFIYGKHARDGVIPALRRAFQETNAGIYAIGQENPEFRGMGTTSTALILRPEGAWVGHVGDSRAYRVRDGKAEQLTFDHSWVWEIARRQGVDPDDLGDFKKNVIVRSLGPDPEVEVDVEGPHPVREGDTYLLCSDGLTGVVPADEAGAVASALPPDEAARFLVNLANLRGGPDNITVLIVQVGGGGDDGPAAGAARGRFGRAVADWNRRVPWPFTALGTGCLLAILSLVMWSGEVTGAVVLFVLAALVILAGLGGLVAHLLQEQPEEPAAPEGDAPRPLNVYKRHECALTKDLADRFARFEAELAESMKAQGVPADWDAHARFVAAAEVEQKRGDPRSIFRARCRSLAFLTEAYQKSRQKEETFRPSWTSPTRT